MKGDELFKLCTHPLISSRKCLLPDMFLPIKDLAHPDALSRLSSAYRSALIHFRERVEQLEALYKQAVHEKAAKKYLDEKSNFKFQAFYWYTRMVRAPVSSFSSPSFTICCCRFLAALY